MSEPRPLGHLVAALSPYADVASMTKVLTGTLTTMLPAHLIRIEYRRSMADRLAGRPGTPVALSIGAGERELILRSRDDGGTDALVVHTVRGVVLSRAPVPIAEWIDALAVELDRIAASDAAARAALDRLLLG